MPDNFDDVLNVSLRHVDLFLTVFLTLHHDCNFNSYQGNPSKSTTSPLLLLKVKSSKAKYHYVGLGEHGLKE